MEGSAPLRLARSSQSCKSFTHKSESYSNLPYSTRLNSHLAHSTYQCFNGNVNSPLGTFGETLTHHSLYLRHTIASILRICNINGFFRIFCLYLTYAQWASTCQLTNPTNCNVAILPVITKDLPIPPRYTEQGFLHSLSGKNSAGPTLYTAIDYNKIVTSIAQRIYVYAILSMLNVATDYSGFSKARWMLC